MSAWLSRNIGPILLTLLASAVVIGAFELLDLVAGSPAAEVGEAGVNPETAEVQLGGIASAAGLIKVTAFLLVGGGLTLLVRRGLDRRPKPRLPS